MYTGVREIEIREVDYRSREAATRRIHHIFHNVTSVTGQ